MGGAYAAEHEATIRTVDRWLETELRRRAEMPVCADGRGGKDRGGGAVRGAVQEDRAGDGAGGDRQDAGGAGAGGGNPGSIFVTIKAAGITTPAVLEGIAEAMPLRMAYKLTSARMYATVERALRDTGRLLIVDEVHRLASRRRDEALHVLRDLHDGAGVPMLWLGMSAIKQYIQAGRSDGEALDQLASRIGLFLDLAEDAQGDDGGAANDDGGGYAAFPGGAENPGDAGSGRYLLALVNELGAGRSGRSKRFWKWR